MVCSANVKQQYVAKYSHMWHTAIYKQLELTSYDNTLQYMLTVVTYGDTWQALMPHGGHISPTRHKDIWRYTASCWAFCITLDDIWRRVSIQCYGELWRCICGKLRCNKCVNFEGVRKDDEAGRYVAGSYNTLLYWDWRAMTISGNTWQPIMHCRDTLLYVSTFVITGCNVWWTPMALSYCKMYVNVLPTCNSYVWRAILAYCDADAL